MSTRAEQILNAIMGLDSLADLPRTGWLLHGVNPCESIAEHSYGVAVVAMMLVDAIRADGIGVDGERVLRMALVHDAAESWTGDIPLPRRSPEVTVALHAEERAAIEGILTPPAREAWAACDDSESTEARVVRAADKIQLMAKALCYERKRRSNLTTFWSSPGNFNDCGFAVAREVFEALSNLAGRSVPR